MSLKVYGFKHIGTCGLPASTTPEFTKHDCEYGQAVGPYGWDIDPALQLNYFKTFFDNITYKCSESGIESFCLWIERNH